MSALWHDADYIPEKRFDVDYVYDMGPMAAIAVGLAMRQKGDR